MFFDLFGLCWGEVQIKKDLEVNKNCAELEESWRVPKSKLFYEKID